MTISIETLRSIFLDIEASVRQRIDAAERLLKYECPTDVLEEAKTVLESVATDEHVSKTLRSDAAFVLLSAEGRKVTPLPAVPRNEAPGSLGRKIAQQQARYERQKILEERGLWPAPDGWDSDIMSEDWEPPPGDSSWVDELPSNAGDADKIEAARLAWLRSLAPKPPGE